MNLGRLGWMAAALLLCGEAVRADDVQNARVMLRPIGHQGQWMGLDVHDRASGRLIAPLRFASNGAIFADRLVTDRKEKDGRVVQTLRFQDLRGRLGSGVGLGDHDWASVQLDGDDPFPRVDFSLALTAFTSSEWERFQGGPCPFNFLTLKLPEAEVWHQRGWLMATPKSDPFVLQQDVAFGGGSVASEFSRNWSYVCALGGSPMPVIGLWAPAARHYVGLEFQGARMSDNTERDVCTAYCWQQDDERQFVAVCYPHSEKGYRHLAYPPRHSKIASHATLVWNLDMPSTSDPNRWLHQLFTERYANAAPPVPHTPNVGYMPGATRLKDWPRLPRSLSGLVVRRPNGDRFTVPGTVEIGGWNWYAESPVEAAYVRNDANAVEELKKDLQYLCQRARVFSAGGEQCVFWDKPIEGRWTDAWGGEPVRSLHNANGFAVGIAMTDIWRHEHATNPQVTANLPGYIDGIYNWARQMVWTRNEFPDVPASPFAIGATLPAVFLLDYYFTFRHTPERAERARAALDLAVSLTYRYLAAWSSDNDVFDNDDPSFLIEPNSGANWAGAPCANEVAWFLDVLAQVYVHSGDARLGYMLRGALDRWHLLYRDEEKLGLTDYDRSAFTEGWGVYSGSGPGDGHRYEYGWANDLIYAWPISNAVARVVCGERAVLACTKTAEHFDISDYRAGGADSRVGTGGDFAFRVVSERKTPFDIALSYPQVNITGKRVQVRRGGKQSDWTDVTRPQHAPASLYIRGLHNGDVVIVGEPRLDAPPLEIPRLFEQAAPLVPRDDNGGRIVRAAGGDEGEFQLWPLDYDTKIEADWNKLDSWAGWVSGNRWAFGVPFCLADPRLAEGQIARDEPIKLPRPITGPATLFFLYAPTEKEAWFSLSLDNATTSVVNAEPALAWRPWPPIYQPRLLLASMNIPVLRSVEAITPHDAMLFALTVYRDDCKLMPLTVASLDAGIGAWRREVKEETELASLRAELEEVPDGRIAVLPTEPGGAAARFAQRCGVLAASDQLTPKQLVEPGRLVAKRYPVVLHLGGEHYPRSVLKKDDGDHALMNYLGSGGLIVCLGREPLPFCYGDDLRRPGAGTDEPSGPSLWAKLGVPMELKFEHPPRGRSMRIEYSASQRVLQNLPWQLDFPIAGDLRLRSINGDVTDSKHLRYQPIYGVVDDLHNDLGDVVASIGWHDGKRAGGRLLYVWSGLLQEPDTATPLLQSVFRFVIEQAKRGQ